MRKTLWREIFKFKHQRLAWVTPLLVALLMGGVALTTHRMTLSDQKFYVTSGYVGFQWSILFLIVISATSVAMEFEYGTIKQLAMQVPHRWLIYVAKFLVVLGYSMLLHVLVVGVTLILKVSGDPRMHWQTIYRYHQSLGCNLGINALLDLYGGVLIVSLVFLLASCSRHGATAIAVGVGACFMGEGLSSLLLGSFKAFVPWLKWNPFNMFYLQEEYGNPDYRTMTHLTIRQLEIGNVVWTLLFIGIGAVIFSRRRL
ncbi:ABC transporter permease [Levilactobacillus enshiensis]|uniref:ABC transporter permease n=1 Tax=Levilactobacillus enshiensis TaxID=2590213 RepID=UPI00131D5E1E|nr:ABC transporter permease [Levilactobacillus enshiensis]